MKKHKVAALVLYNLLHSQDIREEFKVKLRNEPSLDTLTYNRHFSSVFFIQEIDQPNGAFDLNSLHIQSGFPLEQTIAPKDNFKQYLLVAKPNSLMHYNFTTQEYNIGFSIERVGAVKYT